MNDVGAQLEELASSLQDVFLHPIKGFGVLSEYARKHVSLATGAGRSRFTQLHPRLDRAASQFEGHVRVLAQVVDRLLRKHGRNIVEKQLATRRLADIMIDLFVLAAVLARVDAQIRSRGEAASRRDLQILDVFAGAARRRIAQNLADVDDNEDESLKDLADHAMDRGGYGWDVFG